MRVAFREWRIRWDPTTGPILQSTMMTTMWTEPDLVADRLPEDSTDFKRLGKTSNPLHGVHACLGWNRSMFLTKPDSLLHAIRIFAVGAVDLQGKVVEHADGVVRAERVTILALRVIDAVRWWDPSTPPFRPNIDSGQAGLAKTRWGAPCGHTDYHAVSGLYQDFWALRRRCATDSGTRDPKYDYGCDGYKNVIVNEMPYTVPHKIEATASVGEIEQRLRQRYEVPRLPESEGPWPYPWGSGPEPKPEPEREEPLEFTD